MFCLFSLPNKVVTREGKALSCYSSFLTALHEECGIELSFPPVRRIYISFRDTISSMPYAFCLRKVYLKRKASRHMRTFIVALFIRVSNLNVCY